MKREQTFIILKPDAIQRGLIGEIFQRIEHKGFKITALKFLVPTEAQVFEHYNKDDVWFEEKGQITLENIKKNGGEITKPAIEYGKGIIKTLVTYMQSYPVVAMVVEGTNVVEIIRKITGDTQPLKADVGTLRGDYSTDSYEKANLEQRGVRNVVHCSENSEDAEREIKIWFKENEIQNYILATEKLNYDVNLDGKPE